VTVDIRAHVVSLNETRARVISELQAELDATAGRERNEEEKAKITRLDARIDEIDAEVREYVARSTSEKEAAELREASAIALGGETNLVRSEVNAEKFLREWVRGEHRNVDLEINLRGAMKEREMLRQGASADEIRAMAWDVSSGSLVVPTTMARSLYEYLEASICGFRMGFTQLSTTTGENIQLPKLNAHAIGTQVAAQNLAIGGTDPTFGRVTVGAYKYGELAQVANELITDAAFDLASWLGADIGRGLGRVIDADLIVGTGSAEPTGYSILAGAGTNAPVTSGGSLIPPTIEKWIDTQYSINDEYRRNAAWLMKDATAGSVRKLRDGAGGTVGAFLWDPSLTNGVQGGQPDRFLGSPVFVDANMTAGTNVVVAVYGDASEYVLRTVGNPVIESDSSFGFNTDSTYFRGKWRVDGQHRDVSAVNTLKQTV
jgi:HK97 family phage major capsid protein